MALLAGSARTAQATCMCAVTSPPSPRCVLFGREDRRSAQIIPGRRRKRLIAARRVRILRFCSYADERRERRYQELGLDEAPCRCDAGTHERRILPGGGRRAGLGQRLRGIRRREDGLGRARGRPVSEVPTSTTSLSTSATADAAACAPDRRNHPPARGHSQRPRSPPQRSTCACARTTAPAKQRQHRRTRTLRTSKTHSPGRAPRAVFDDALPSRSTDPAG